MIYRCIVEAQVYVDARDEQEAKSAAAILMAMLVPYSHGAVTAIYPQGEMKIQNAPTSDARQ